MAAMARCMSLYVEADAEPLLRTLAWCLALGPTDEGWGEDSIRWSHEFGSELGQQVDLRGVCRLHRIVGES